MHRVKILPGSLAVGALVFLGAALLAPAAEAQSDRAARSRSSASSSARSSSSSGATSSSRSSGTVSSPRTSSSSRGAAVTRSSGRSASGPRTMVRGTSRYRGSRGSWGGYTGGYRYHYPYYYSWGYPYYGWSLGLGWWGAYYYGLHPYSHFPYSYYPYQYGRPPHYAARVYSDPVGAFDLNIKPKKTQVWVDGRYVGTAGRFDGFPDFLWLEEGDHQLVFFLDGYVTIERQVETLAGVVADLRLVMERGTSTPPSQVAVRPAPAAMPVDTARPRVPLKRAPAEPMEHGVETETAESSRDLRETPSRLVLIVEPADASVYLDGRYLGTGRDLSRLHAGLLIDSGAHRLEIVRPGFEDRAVDFSVAAGEEERIEIGLEPS